MVKSFVLNKVGKVFLVAMIIIYVMWELGWYILLGVEPVSFHIYSVLLIGLPGIILAYFLLKNFKKSGKNQSIIVFNYVTSSNI